MLNRSAILKDAWTVYRRLQSGRPFNRKTFGFYLACAWDRAKTAMLSPVDRRRQQIEREIEGLRYKSFRYDIGRREGALRAELRALAA
ncbi:MAG: hypothetical protein KDK08_19440 [Rhizobiaceae bacterium]|nr:hypothetical protein [Rhizobiaceae bacterium]